MKNMEHAKRILSKAQDIPYGASINRIQPPAQKPFSNARGVSGSFKNGKLNRFLLDQYGQAIVPNASSGNLTSRRTASFDSGGGPSIDEGAGREFYDYRTTPTFMQLPQQNNFQELNFFRRAIYLRDELVGQALDTIAEIPYGRAEFLTEDPTIRRMFERQAQLINIYDLMPRLTLHYLVHGEVIPWMWWDDNEGLWSHAYSIDPNDVQVSIFPYSRTDAALELKPYSGVQHVLNSSLPRDREIQKGIPAAVLQALRRSDPILLDPDHTTYISRETFPLMNYAGFQVRGQSILDRLFRVWVLYEKVSEAQLAIADNYIYPITIVKLGDEKWFPTQEDMEAFSAHLEASRFDIKPFIVYHNAIELDRIEFADAARDFSGDFERIDELKLMALGFPKDFIMGESTFATSQTEKAIFMMRLSTLKDMFHSAFLYPKVLDEVARKHEMFKTTQARINNKIKVKNTKKVWFRDPENPRNSRLYSDTVDDRELATPEIVWETKITTAQDSDYFSMLKDLYEASRDKTTGLVSRSTLLRAAGLDYKGEMKSLKADVDLETEILGQEDEEESDDGNDFDMEGNQNWIKKIAKAIRRQTGKSTQKELREVKNFLKREAGTLKNELGILDNRTIRDSLSMHTGAYTRRRVGDMEKAFILPPTDMILNVNDQTWESILTSSQVFSDHERENILAFDKQVANIIDNCALKDNPYHEILNEIKSSLFLNVLKSSYTEGKKYAYQIKSNKILHAERVKLDLVEDEYLSDVNASGVSNFSDIDTIDEIFQRAFQDSEIVHALKSDLQDIELKAFVIDASWHIRRAIRNAILSARTIGVLYGYKEQGIKEFVWNAADDNPINLARNGNVYDVDSFLTRYGTLIDKSVRTTCFVKNTKVIMADGSRRSIYDICGGDIVMGRTGPTKVMMTASRTYSSFMVSINGVESTDDHPYIIDKHGAHFVVPAHDLLCGDKILTLDEMK